MTETLTHPEYAQEEKNREMLRQAELGVVLERAYIEAVKQDDRLKDIEIIPLDKDSHRAAMARPSWHPEAKGKHQIHIRLDDLDETLNRYDELMDKVPGAREIFAEQLWVDPSDVTPQLLYTQSVLHEMGHLTEYMDYEDNHLELEERQRVEYVALPIGNATTSAILNQDTKAGSFVADNWENISAKLKVGSIDELAEKQHTAYRSMTSEAHADNFAADVLNQGVLLKDALITPGSVEYLRDYDLGSF